MQFATVVANELELKSSTGVDIANTIAQLIQCVLKSVPRPDNPLASDFHRYIQLRRAWVLLLLAFEDYGLDAFLVADEREIVGYILGICENQCEKEVTCRQSWKDAVALMARIVSNRQNSRILSPGLSLLLDGCFSLTKSLLSPDSVPRMCRLHLSILRLCQSVGQEARFSSEMWRLLPNTASHKYITALMAASRSSEGDEREMQRELNSELHAIIAAGL